MAARLGWRLAFFLFFLFFLKSYTVLAVYETPCRVFYITEVNPRQPPRIETNARFETLMIKSECPNYLRSVLYIGAGPILQAYIFAVILSVFRQCRV